VSVQRIERIAGRALPLRGDDIDTDRIIPARYLKTVSFEGLERHVFEDDRRTAAHPFDDGRFAGASVLLAGRNFGCGSSREHAPQALYRWGIRAIVAESFADIFFGNSAMIGLPCVTASPEDVAALVAVVEQRPETRLVIDLASLRCDADGRTSALQMPASAREAFLTGAWDTTGLLLDRFDDVRATEARLPYRFTSA
jgi:3-isopropylmalate/(R)-2-methylmalate dehydratase small subunit